MGARILIVDDEPAQLRLAEHILSSRGYQVLKAGSGQEAIRFVYESQPDLILLDVMMPGLDGLQTCSCIRETSDAPIIMLTGRRNSEEDIVNGLEAGADDYLTKPIGNRELLARVRAALRRAEKPGKASSVGRDVISCGRVTVNAAERRVTVEGQKVKLTPREFRLLTLLIENIDRILTHQQILENVWGWEYVDDIDYVRIYISHLRQKIEPEPSRPRYILTEPGVGYYFHNPEV